MVVSSTACQSASSRRSSNSLPLNTLKSPKPNYLPGMPRHQVVIAGDDLQRYAHLFQRFNRALHAFLGRVEKQQEPGESHVGFIFDGIGLVLCADGFDRHPQHPVALGAPVLESFLDLGLLAVIQGGFHAPPICTREQTASTLSSAPLVTMLCELLSRHDHC